MMEKRNQIEKIRKGFVFHNSILTVGNSQFIKRSAFGKLCAINVGAFFVSCKGFLRRFRISVNLPSSNAFEVFCPVFNESANVFRRITEKKPYFVGKFTFFFQTAY